jgi:histidinol-phosphate aminotransferase
MSWQANVRVVTPYKAGEQPKSEGIIKLNTNECPYPPSPLVAASLARLSADDFRLYPDPDCSALRSALADYYGLSPEQVFVGVGSDDVLALSFLTFFNSPERILFPDVTYSFYDVWAKLYSIPYRTITVNHQLQIVQVDYLTENGGIIFPNPNAPTSVLEGLDLIEYIVSKNKNSVVIIDEAYIDYGGTSALPLTKKYNNLLVVQTFSKSRAMAGMRIGYAMGDKELIRHLTNTKFAYNSYTMSRAALALGVAALEDDAYFKDITAKIVATREWFKQELSRLGFSYPEPMGNFVFATHPRIEAKRLFNTLREKGIYVRYWDAKRIDNHLRITIGTDEEMRKLVASLETIINV